MLHTGLVSITFRRLAPREIVDLAVRAALEGIEWGGDVHVPHGDLAAAARVRRLTEDAALRVSSYGSYYRAGEQNPVPFERVLATCGALGAPAVRVWAGRRGSADADEAYRRGVVQDARRAAELAAAAGVRLAFEFHGGTLTDTSASAARLLEDVARDNAYVYWQPPRGAGRDECLAGLRGVASRLLHVHVFAWRRDTGERLPLADGGDDWRAYLAGAADAPGDRFALLEFVRDDSPEQFLADAATLKRWLAALRGA